MSYPILIFPTKRTDKVLPDESDVMEMAWFAVHENVKGPKLRSLGKELGCSVFEALGILNFVWMWGLTNAEKNGHILSADEEDIARYLYGVGYGCQLDQHDIVKALIDTNWIDKDNGELYIHDWSVWQDQWYKAKDRLERDVERKRVAAQKAKVPRKEDPDSLDTEPGVDSENALTGEAADCRDTEESEAAPKSLKYTPAFEVFWEAYPRKVCKGTAYRKYKARLDDGYSPEQLLEACNAYARECRTLHTDRQYIKHPATFLSDSMPFIDYLARDKTGYDSEPVLYTENPFAEYGGGRE